MELKNAVFYGNSNGVTRDIHNLMSVRTTNRNTYHKKDMNKKPIMKYLDLCKLDQKI